MQKILRYLLLALVVVGCALPTFNKAEAARVAVLPVITNEDAESYAVSRRVWNEQCTAFFKFPEFDIVDDSDMTVVLNKVNYEVVAKDGVNEALIRQVMADTKADIGVMLVMDELKLEPEFPPTKGNYYRLSQKGNLLYVNNISGVVKKERISDWDDYDYALTIRGDFVHDQFRNTVIRSLNKVIKAK